MGVQGSRCCALRRRIFFGAASATPLQGAATQGVARGRSVTKFRCAVCCATPRDAILQAAVEGGAVMSGGATKLLRGKDLARACASLRMAFLLFAALGFAAMAQ